MANKIDNLFNSIDKIKPNIANQCMNCGAQLTDDYSTTCIICGFDSSDVFECPYKVIQNIKLASNQKTIELGFCNLTKKQCRVQGFDFEICSTFRSLDSIKEGD